MDTDWLIVLLTAVVVLFATTIHGVVGFGTGQITMGVLPLFREAGPASVIISVVVFLTNTAFFATNLLYRLGVMMFTGDITGPLMLEALIMVPALILGTWLGIKLFEHMPKKIFRWAVLVLLLVLGTLLIVG